jgi:Protein of unknown function (DUF1579)
MTDNAQAQMPTPDPALQRLDRFVGSWRMRGRFVGAGEDTITGEATYRWLPGGFFLEQRISLNFMGMAIESLELIGYDPESGTFPSTVFANMAPTPLPYVWRVDGDDVTISVSYGPLDATFTGRFAADGKTFGGGWRPNPGADPNVNAAYDIEGQRVD